MNYPSSQLFTLVVKTTRDSTGSILQNQVQNLSSTTGLKTGYRNAPLTGKFIPGQYKVTTMDAQTRSVTPSGVGQTEKWERSNTGGSYTTTTSVTADPLPCSLCNHVVYLTSAFLPRTDPTVTSLKKEALLRAYGKVGNLAQLELGCELGELKETLELLTNTIYLAFRPRQLWAHFESHMYTEKGMRKLTRKALKALPNKYMEFRYGWMPLMRSISSIYQVLVDKLVQLKDMETIYTAKGKATSTVHVNSIKRNFYYGALKSTQWYSTDNEVTARACVHYKVLSPPTLSDLLGLSPKFIPEIAWELTTLSFVWDWFLNLGIWLAALRGRLDINYQILGNTVSAVINTKGISTCEVAPSGWTPVRRLVQDVGGKDYHRLINQPFPMKPGFRASSVMDWKKWLDLIIISTRFLPKKTKSEILNSFVDGIRGTDPKYYTE